MLADNSNPQPLEMARENSTFSAEVTLTLLIGEERLGLGQLGPGFAILRNAVSINACDAMVETDVDGVIDRWPIRITSPIDTESKRFSFESV